MDVEFERPQQHFGFVVLTQWALGLWPYQPGIYLLAHFQHRRVVSLLLYRALLSGNGRHGHGGESVAYADTDAAVDWASDRHN